jgi:hypothetical protein
VAQLGFTSSSEFFAWVAECDASRDGAVAEAPYRTPALAEKALAEEQRRHKTAAREKALADEAKERREVVAHAKALAAKVLADKQRGQVAAVRAKVFAAQALAIATSLPPRPTSYVGAVLSTLGGGLLPAMLSSPPSPTTGSPLQVVRRRAQPRRRVGRRHGPRAPNPQENLLCRRRHRPRAPNPQEHLLRGRRHRPCAPN